MSPAKTPASKIELPVSAAPARRGGLLQRKCACGADARYGVDCDSCAGSRLQRRATAPVSSTGVPPIVDTALASPGQPLEAGLRRDMERRFGSDLGDVRIHDDATAAASARAVRAHAYTVGQDIVFAAERYRPDTDNGRALLAHELAHTMQQRGLHCRGDGIVLDESAAGQSLERDADAIADAALRGGTPPAVRPAGVTTLSRAQDPKTPGPAKKPKKYQINVASKSLKSTHDVEREEGFNTGEGKKGKTSAGFVVDVLKLPASKGPDDIIKIWQDRAKADAVVAFLDVESRNTKAGLWQEREGTDELRDRWRQKMGWKNRDEADQAWQAAGGAKTFPYVKSSSGEVACQMDHIIELQVGGGNEDSNIQVLDGKDNRESGGALKNEVFGIADQLKQRLKDEGEDVEEVKLRFLAVEPEDPTGRCGPCCKVGRKAKAGASTSEEAKDLEPYNIVGSKKAGGARSTLRVKKGEKESPIRDSGIPENQSASELIAGLLLTKLHRSGKKHQIDARIDDGKARETRLPIALEGTQAIKLDVTQLGEDHLLELATKAPHLTFTYPYLSKGVITKLAIEDDQSLSGEGKLTPTAKFLPELTVRFARNQFSIVTALDTNTLRQPLPGMKITKAELGIDLMPEFKPRGTLEIALGAGGRGGKPLAEAAFNVTRDQDGLVLDGVLNAHLPGVDKAEGKVRYANQAWTGNVRIESAQIKLKYVKSGFVNVALSQAGIEPSGELALELPGNNSATVGLRKSGPKWLYYGSGTFNVKRDGVEPIKVNVSYDGEKLEADGSTRFEFKKLHGTIHVFFAAEGDNVKFWGHGSLAFAKGKAKGKFDPIKLSPEGKLSGKGEATYQINDQLQASAGIEIGENEKVRFSGALALTKPIDLFPRKGGQKELFRTPTLTIPLPFVSIGTVGIVVKVYGAMGVHYGIGPGQIQNARIAANFSPFEEDGDLDVTMDGRLAIPASAGIDASINGDIALDVLIASVSGGLAIVSTFELGGEAFVEGKIQYAKRKVAVDGKAGVKAALDLQLGLKAHVAAEAGIPGFSVRTTKEWDLARRKVPTGLAFGMAVPIRYASGEEFKMPGLDEIEWSAPPKIDVVQILKNMLEGAPGKETRG